MPFSSIIYNPHSLFEAKTIHNLLKDKNVNIPIHEIKLNKKLNIDQTVYSLLSSYNIELTIGDYVIDNYDNQINKFFKKNTNKLNPNINLVNLINQYKFNSSIKFCGLSTSLSNENFKFLLNHFEKNNLRLNATLNSQYVKNMENEIYKLLNKINCKNPSTSVFVGNFENELIASVNSECWTIGLINNSPYINSINNKSYNVEYDKINTRMIFESMNVNFVIDSIDNLHVAFNKINNYIKNDVGPKEHLMFFKDDKNIFEPINLLF